MGTDSFQKDHHQALFWNMALVYEKQSIKNKIMNKNVKSVPKKAYIFNTIRTDSKNKGINIHRFCPKGPEGP